MANRRVSLMIRINDGGKRPFVKPVYATNGRIRPLYALVDGVPQRRPEGTYYPRWSDGERRVWEPAGVDPYAALDRKRSTGFSNAVRPTTSPRRGLQAGRGGLR